MQEFRTPTFCVGFEGEMIAVEWSEEYRGKPVATKTFKGGTLRPATPAEQRRYGVVNRLVGSRWYKSSHTACVYPKLKPHKLSDIYAANAAQVTRELSRPSSYALHGDGDHAAAAIRNTRNRTNEEFQAAIREARYLDWLDAREAAAAEPEYRMAA